MFSWRRVRRGEYERLTGRALPAGVYAGDVVDQHVASWCGCCYLVAAVQCVEDRARIAHTKRTGAAPPSLRVSMQAVMDHFREWDAPTPGWNACHGGFPLHVLECLARRECPLLLEGPSRWFGFARTTTRCLRSDATFEVRRARRLPPSQVQHSLLHDGPLVLEVNADTLKAVTPGGLVYDLTPRDPNHAVCVVGWTTRHGVMCWIVRNSWGTRRAPRALPDDLSCVANGYNVCSVEWEPWRGTPDDPGFVLLPASFPPLHRTQLSPWIVADVA